MQQRTIELQGDPQLYFQRCHIYLHLPLTAFHARLGYHLWLLAHLKYTHENVLHRKHATINHAPLKAL